MAENAHQVPEKYGPVEKIFHPRIQSYHRRLLAAMPSGLLCLASLAFVGYKRPILPVSLGLILLAVLAALSLYSALRPQLIVLTEGYLLRGRLFGWQVVDRQRIDHTIMAERLTPRQAAGKQLKGLAALRYQGIPALWAVDSRKKRVFRLDGRMWDAKTAKALAASLSPQTTVYQLINVTQMNKQHPGLVTFNELHPGWKSATAGLLSVVFILLLAFFTFMPDQTLQELGIL
ncbi:MAG: hypothetical protein SOR40_05475 [Rothia sp. (in: high G+C Gram-positive bacteria)]|nr:hypothetical protein [Rothia sp. (in: high G+C Gram-positive bacteria)]